MGKTDKTKVSPADGDAKPNAKSQRGALQKLSKIRIPGNKEVPIVLRAIFSNYDKDGSGTITKPEMTALVLDLQSLLPGTPAHLKHCSEVVAKIAMAALDLDKGGTIDEDEFVEWCQQNLFLTPEDRATMLVQNMDLSQFVTALEMCVKMQLAGIGPYSYYTPPPPTFKQKYCVTYKHCFCWCCLGLFIFNSIFVPIAIFVIYPWAQAEGYISIDIKPVKKGSDDDDEDEDADELSPSGSDTSSAATVDGEETTPAGNRRFLAEDSTFALRGSTPRLDLVDALPEEKRWDMWEESARREKEEEQSRMLPSVWTRFTLVTKFLVERVSQRAGY
jgi:Ca2+-binding EF-hand superfamily protein